MALGPLPGLGPGTSLVGPSVLPSPEPRVNTGGVQYQKKCGHLWYAFSNWPIVITWDTLYGNPPDELLARRRAATQREARRIRRSRTTARRSHVRVE